MAAAIETETNKSIINLFEKAKEALKYAPSKDRDNTIYALCNSLLQAYHSNNSNSEDLLDISIKLACNITEIKLKEAINNIIYKILR